MAKKPAQKKEEDKEVHVTVESWQWESPSRRRFTWKHWIALAVLLAFAILLVMGFILIAGVILILGIILNLVLYFFKKIT